MPRDSLKTLGASNHSDVERSKLDYYGTDPRSTRALLNNEGFDGKIWEPCAGHHLMVDVIEEFGYKVYASDIAEYEGYQHDLIDFLNYNGEWDGNIVTNPPYNASVEFAEKALSLLQHGKKLAMFLRLQWLEGVSRYERIFKNNPPKTIYIFTNRQVSDRNDDFTTSSSVAYMWVVWEKDSQTPPVVKWVSTK